MDNSIIGTIIEMRVIAEGAISLYEKNPKSNADDYNLIDEALHMLKDRISYCLLACQNSGKNSD